MANIIFSNNHAEIVQMSNGLTSAIVAVVCLAGGRLAKTDGEMRIMIWMAQRDQSVHGPGLVGFDVRNLPWDKSVFSEQKSFLINVITAAIEKTDWDKLDYELREDWILDRLSTFKRLIEQLNISEILPEENSIWEFQGGNEIFQKCKLHGIFLHAEGCVICNDK